MEFHISSIFIELVTVGAHLVLFNGNPLGKNLHSNSFKEVIFVFQTMGDVGVLGDSVVNHLKLRFAICHEHLGNPWWQVGFSFEQRKKGPWLFRVYVGEYTTQLCWDYNESLQGSRH